MHHCIFALIHYCVEDRRIYLVALIESKMEWDILSTANLLLHMKKTRDVSQVICSPVELEPTLFAIYFVKCRISRNMQICLWYIFAKSKLNCFAKLWKFASLSQHYSQAIFYIVVQYTVLELPTKSNILILFELSEKYFWIFSNFWQY